MKRLFWMRMFAIIVSSGLSAGLVSAQTVNWNADPMGGFKALLQSRAAVAAPAPFMARPASGSGFITGAMNHSQVQLRFDRRLWTITGGINNSPVEIRCDPENRTISGGANHSPVELGYARSPERFIVEGGANRSPVRLSLDWSRGTLEGYSNHSTVQLVFDLGAGTISGDANHAPVSLSYDRLSGTVTGFMNRSPVEITLENLELEDFLKNFFLFLNTVSPYPL